MRNRYNNRATPRRRIISLGLVAVASFAGFAANADPGSPQIVVCAPGSPGTTDEAKPALDAFAGALTSKAGVTLSAIYDPTEQGGVDRLKSAGIGIVSLPFFLAHEQELGLHARLAVVQKGRPALEQWALVAQKGTAPAAGSFDGFTIMSNAAFAPAFVRGDVLGGLGALPATAKLQQSSAVLSSLRKASNGDHVAVVLDGPQLASLASLPFAAKLDVVARSGQMPAGLVVTVDARMPQKTWSGIESALLGIQNDKAGADALEGIQMAGFVQLDGKALAAARAAYQKASK